MKKIKFLKFPINHMTAYYIQKKCISQGKNVYHKGKNEKFKLLIIFPEYISHCHAAFLSKTVHVVHLTFKSVSSFQLIVFLFTFSKLFISLVIVLTLSTY